MVELWVTLILLSIFCYNFQVLYNSYVLFLKPDIFEQLEALSIQSQILGLMITELQFGEWAATYKSLNISPKQESSTLTLLKKSCTFKID